MLKWFSKSGFFIQLVVILSIALAFWIPAFVNPKPIVVSNFDGPIFNFIGQILCDYKLFQIILAFVFMLLQAFGLTFVFQVNGLIHRSNFLPAFPVIIGFSWNPDFLFLHSFFFAGVFLIAGIYYLLRIFGKQAAYREVFSASFAFSMASLFFIPLAYLIIIVWFTFITLRISEWRDYFISLIAFAMPYLYYASGLYWNSNFIEGSKHFLHELFHLSLPQPIGFASIIWLSLCAFALIVSMLIVFGNLKDKLLNIRRKTWIINNFLMASILTLSAVGFPIIAANYIFIVPLAFFYTAAIVQAKRTLFIDLLFLGLIVIYIFLRTFVLF